MVAHWHCSVAYQFCQSVCYSLLSVCQSSTIMVGIFHREYVFLWSPGTRKKFVHTHTLCELELHIKVKTEEKDYRTKTWCFENVLVTENTTTNIPYTHMLKTVGQCFGLHMAQVCWKSLYPLRHSALDVHVHFPLSPLWQIFHPSQMQVMSGSHSEIQHTVTTVSWSWRTLVEVMMPCSA